MENTIKVQQYMCVPNMSKDDTALLSAMRTRTVSGIGNNFGDMYQGDKCPLWIEDCHINTIPDLLTHASLQHMDSNNSFT